MIVEVIILFHEIIEEDRQEILLVIQMEVVQETHFLLQEIKIQTQTTLFQKRDLQIILFQSQVHHQTTHLAVQIRTEAPFLQTVLQVHIHSNHKQMDFKVPLIHFHEQPLPHQIHFQVAPHQQPSTLFTENKTKFLNVFETIHFKSKSILM